MARNILDSKGGRNSVHPCTEGVTFHPFIYMVPQFRPDSVLMLGYAGGTVAGLIRLFYGEDVPITGVDPGPTESHYNARIICADARQYVRDASNFDAVIVDIYQDGEHTPPEWITAPGFVADLRRIANYIIVHAKAKTNMGKYGKPLKVLRLNDSRFYYYVVNRIARLPIR